MSALCLFERLVQWYLDDLQLVEEVSENGVATDSAAGKGGSGMIHLDSVLLWSQKTRMLYFL